MKTNLEEPKESSPKSKWNSYKETMKRDVSIFDLAREGRVNDLRDTVELIRRESHFSTSKESKNLSFIASFNQKNKRGHSPLMLAVYNNQLDMAKYLIEMNADVNSIDANGNSILMGAAFKGNTDAIDLLIENGARINDKNYAGMDAYDWAKLFGRKNAMEKLSLYQGKSSHWSSRLGIGFKLLKSIFIK